jgi:hypothetical protein
MAIASSTASPQPGGGEDVDHVDRLVDVGKAGVDGLAVDLRAGELRVHREDL